ncbi:winged helix-turn-helix domain-containing protein [Actinopolyspora mortivallis]|uniref:winged helix-turn-helix domain-containing protein n=1 Tax=Actinopolyspora mortivallis TaxID=33906 RepID=UPI001C62D981|nr:winged helix-turn-helix domain-containing protein [Actinopolyspora mortivallis]
MAEKLRQAIIDGVYSPGQKLPSGQELAAELGVAVGTVRSALDLLREDGVVETHHGRGSFVLDRPESSAERGTPDELALIRSELAEINRRLASLEERLDAADR